MTNMAFLDDLPDLGFPQSRRKRKRLPASDSEGMPVVYYQRVKCPGCGSKDCPVYSSDDLPIRRHRCKNCDLTFKSVEI